jgi:hypothetical protein
MREKRKLLSFLVVVGIVCAVLVAYAQFFYNPDRSKSTPGTAKPLTLRLASSQAKVALPDAATLEYGELYTLADDWSLAARFTIDLDKLNEFITDNALPNPVAGLRPVPGRDGKLVDSTFPDQPEAVGTSTPSPISTPDTIVAPPALGTVLTDDPGWHPERPVRVSGVNRMIKDGVARWFMFDLDASDKVIVYVYATSEDRAVPPSPSKSATQNRSPGPSKS